MPDGKTIVGRDASNEKKLVAEDITSNAITNIGTLTSSIYTVLYDPKTRSLFAGDYNGHLHQYQKAKDTTSFVLVKDHGDIGLGELRSSALIGSVAIFGGSNSCLVAVDVPSKEVFTGTFKTAFRDIYSLQACEVSKSSTLLSVGGYDPSYSSSVTDILEVETQEDIPGNTISTKTEKSHPTQKVVPDPVPVPVPHPQYSQSMVRSLLSDVFAYVDVLFRNFTRHYEARLSQKKGNKKFYANNQIEETSRIQDTAPDFELSEKVRKIVDDFRLEDESNFTYDYNILMIQTSSTRSLFKTSQIPKPPS